MLRRGRPTRPVSSGRNKGFGDDSSNRRFSGSSAAVFVALVLIGKHSWGIAKLDRAGDRSLVIWGDMPM